ncbi:TRNA splicing endonuclease subunit (Sen54) [Penicillium odoratum]|uniref:TRNA splicing endonuclease subunit (Sen54) n=1 Tax=Penicillium odoratum TaxID=1167516 RepID=UPI0025488CD9|nr:TRNA splicing endonuclease subunit (Sen54) [Penicillium odoratum]KAJ5760344.1 TRNA splicing endonuclease subunit (Sen54) [Penicillium odoratum]
MADADDEVVNSTSAEAPQIEVDLSDETQDFRLLNHLSFLGDTAASSLPKRGEKDFEPNPTEFQADVLSASRQAMHNALSHPRIHHPKNRIIGFYAPDGPAPPPQFTESAKNQGKGLNVSPNACVYIPNPKGTFFRNMGQTDRWNRMWLLPEEALYMIERGSLDIRWPTSLTGATEGSGDCENGDELSIPMSLQAAYACFMGRGGLTLERFTVFTGLKRLGYSVLRAPGWDDSARPDSDHEEKDAYAQLRHRGPGLAGILASISNWIHDPMSTASTAAGPVIGCGIHRTYADVYRKMELIPWYDPVLAPQRDPLDTVAPFRVVFHVYKPTNPLKKSALPVPDFRIAVVNTREQTTIPTLPELSALLESTPLDPPSGEKMNRLMYMRLRHGYRNVVLAVVDQGVTSFLRIGDAAFGKEKLFDIKHVPFGNKRHGNFKPRRR